MFGLEGQKKKKQVEEFFFDLEKEIKGNPAKYKELKEKIENRIQRIKEVLRTGETQDEFDRFGLLLHGYTSLLKVLSRLTSTPSK
jgi:hypothetical protein